MTIRVHLANIKEPNAFSTLGGNIVISKSLIKVLHSENALAMVMAHEIGHIKHRDPIVSLGGGVAVAVLLSTFIGGTDSGILVNWAVGMTQMSFSRNQEDRADKEALMALKNLYGHTGGADEFFVYIMREYPELSRMPGFFSAHPSPQARLEAIRATFLHTPQNLTPLPENLKNLQHYSRR
jgi:Zn-dependent protease with chaperone function